MRSRKLFRKSLCLVFGAQSSSSMPHSMAAPRCGYCTAWTAFPKTSIFPCLNRKMILNSSRTLMQSEKNLVRWISVLKLLKKQRVLKRLSILHFIKAGTREHLFKIDVPEEIFERVHRNERMTIKLEVDTDPPGGFETEAKTLLQPIAFSVRSYKRPDLFAGKVSAVLQRAWQSGRVKGRDYYDFVWYVARDVPVHLSHLEQRLRQTGAWLSDSPLMHDDLLKLLEDKFSHFDAGLAKRDVAPFIKDSQAVDIWSNEFFLSLLPRLKST